MISGTNSISGVGTAIAPTDIRQGASVDGTAGTLKVPVANQVTKGTTFGPDANGATTGTAAGAGGGSNAFSLSI